MMTVDELKAAFVDQPGRASSLLVLPGPDEDVDPEGRVVIDGRGPTWSVYNYSHGVRDRREFDSLDEAVDFTYHYWLRDDDV